MLKKCRIFWEVVVPTKTRKNSNKHGSGNAYFLRSVHLSIVADDATFGCESTFMIDKVIIEETNTVWAQSCPRDPSGQRDAFRWTDVTLSTSYNKFHEWTSGWTSTMNKYTGRRKYAFPDPWVMVFSFMLWYILLPLTILDTFVFIHYEQVYRTQKVCVSGPMCNGLFIHVVICTMTSHNTRHFCFYPLWTSVQNSESMRFRTHV